MTGGDTLMGYMKLIGCTQITPVCEIEQDVYKRQPYDLFDVSGEFDEFGENTDYLRKLII